MSDYLCEELLIVEIFERLPVKSLIRFKSLSKTWCSRISSPKFQNMHTLRFGKKAQKVLDEHQSNHENYNSEDMYTLNSDDKILLYPRHIHLGITTLDFPRGNIVGSCNGIICLLDLWKCITLWNPSLKRIQILRDHPSLRYSRYSNRVAVGFGFDPITVDHKIVTISYKETGDLQSSYVYSLKKGTWSEIALPTTPFYDVTSHACFSKGVLYWLVKCDSNNIHHRHIMTFNMTTHSFSNISLPNPGPSHLTRQLTIINGSLASISSIGDTTCIWVKKEHSYFVDWSLLCELKTPFTEGGINCVLQLRTNSDLLFNIHGKGFKAYNAETWKHSMVVDYKAAYEVDMETSGGSLKLLDTNFRQKICRQNEI